MSQINGNNNSIPKVGSTNSTEPTGSLGKLAAAGLLALSSIVSGFNSNPASPSANLAQATSAAANIVG